MLSVISGILTTAVDNALNAVIALTAKTITLGAARTALTAKQEKAIVSMTPTPCNHLITVLKWFSSSKTPAIAGNAAADTRNCCSWSVSIKVSTQLWCFAGPVVGGLGAPAWPPTEVL